MKPLTELEGAVLMEVGRQAGVTAFQVRRAFQASPSSAWSKSAGAVYTVVERLIQAKLLKTSASLDGRGTRRLELTPAGRKAHRAWLQDVQNSSSLGSDPFRLRAPGWLELPKKDYLKLLACLQSQLEHQLAELNAFKRHDADAHDQVRAVFAIDLLRSRLKWVNEQLKNTGQG